MTPILRGIVLGAALVFGASCRFDELRFYEVTRTPTEECDILPQGEFCVTPDELSPPTFEVWSVETRGDETRVFADEEVWVADALDEGEDPNFVSSSKREISAREPGPCTTESARAIELLATDADLTGQSFARSRLDGPEECGETPRGQRTVARLDGILTGAP